MKKETLVDLSLLALCAALLICLGSGVFFNLTNDFSEEENRPLSSFPRIGEDSIIEGDFFKGLGDFYSDRISFRLKLVRLKGICELTLGKRENNGVLFVDGNTLVQRCEYNSTSLLEKNLNAINAEKVTLVTVPRSIDVYFQSEDTERIRNMAFSYSPDGEELYRRLCTADKQDLQVYYKTDHHLDYDGAYELYTVLCDSLGVTPYKKEDFEAECVSGDFLGTSYSKGGALGTETDSIFLPRYNGDTKFDIECLDSGCMLASLYERSFLTKKDKYSVFLGGNHGTLTVKSTAEQDRPRLLLIKDSFANAVIPMLARHFDITVRDPRYDASPISCEYDAALVVCGIDTLATTPFSFSIKQ